MKIPRRIFVPPWLLLLASLAWSWVPGLASADDRVTVVLKSGTRYEHVLYEVLPKFSALELRDGMKDDSTHANAHPLSIERVSFTEVEAIYDAQGKNLAPRLLGNGYRPIAAEHVSEAPSAPRRFPASRPWHVALSFQGGYDLPFGDYYTGVKSGPGFGGSAHVRLTNELALRADVSRLGMDFERSNHVVSYDPDVVIVSEKDDLDALRTMIGLEYHQPWFRQGRWSGLWYLHSSFGAIRHGIHTRVRVRQVSTGQEAELVGDDTSTKFAMTSGAGALLVVTRHTGVSVSTDLDAVWTKTYEGGFSSQGVKGLVLGMRAGLAWVR